MWILFGVNSENRMCHKCYMSYEGLNLSHRKRQKLGGLRRKQEGRHSPFYVSLIDIRL